MFDLETLERVFSADELDAYLHGGCMDFAAGISQALGKKPHSFMMLLAPEARRTIIGHVLVEVDGVFKDAAGSHDKTDVMVHWSWLSGIPAVQLSIAQAETLEEVRATAKRLRCRFESDCEEEASEIAARLRSIKRV